MVGGVSRLLAVGLTLALIGGLAAGCSPSVSELKAKGDVDGLIGVLRGFGDDAGAAATALGEIGDARAVPALADAAISAGGETSTAAVEALGKIDDPGAVEGLAAVLRDQSAEDALRAGAARALGELGNKTAIQPLIEAVQRIDDVTVLAASVDALVELGPTADEDAIRALLSTTIHEPALADAVDRVFAGMGAGAVDSLLAALIESSAHRGAAGDALVRRGAAAAAPLAAALGSASDDDFFQIVDILERIEDPAVAAALAKMVEDDDADARVNGIRALALVGGKGAAASILPALKDPELEVRLVAIEALGTLGDTTATAALVKLLKDKEVKVRTAAAKALGELGDKDATKALVAGLKDAKLSAEAALALAKLYKDDPDKLLPYLKAKATVGVYYGLIRIGADSTIAALVKALNSFGTKAMAEHYLNCGNPDLEDAAKAWAKKHGYTVVTQPGGGAVQWGSGL